MSLKKPINEQQLGILHVSEVFVLSAAGAGAGDVKGTPSSGSNGA